MTTGGGGRSAARYAVTRQRLSADVQAGVQAGDEVILPAYTFIATASAIIQLGALPVFADIESTTFHLDARSVDEQVTEIKDLREKEESLKNKIFESEQIEDRILTEMQSIKDEKLKAESQLEDKEKELIELKKKIKIMRRDIKKT